MKIDKVQLYILCSAAIYFFLMFSIYLIHKHEMSKLDRAHDLKVKATKYEMDKLDREHDLRMKAIKCEINNG